MDMTRFKALLLAEDDPLREGIVCPRRFAAKDNPEGRICVTICVMFVNVFVFFLEKDTQLNSQS